MRVRLYYGGVHIVLKQNHSGDDIVVVRCCMCIVRPMKVKLNHSGEDIVVVRWLHVHCEAHEGETESQW